MKLQLPLWQLSLAKLKPFFFLTLLFCSLVFTKQAWSQSACDPVGIVGDWEEEQSLVSALFSAKRLFSFDKNSNLEIYLFDSEIEKYVLFCTGKYSLDNEEQPNLITFNNLSMPFFDTEGSISFPVNVFNESLLEWGDLFGFNMRLRRLYPEFQHDGRIASKEELLKEILKRPDAPNEAISYFDDDQIDDLRKALSEFLGVVESKKIYFKVLAELGSSILDWLNQNQAYITYNYLMELADELCSEIKELEAQKLEHWERWEYIKLLYPDKAKDPKVQETLNNDFYAIVDKQQNLEAIRRGVLLELGIIKSAYSGLEDLYRLSHGSHQQKKHK